MSQFQRILGIIFFLILCSNSILAAAMEVEEPWRSEDGVSVRSPVLAAHLNPQAWKDDGDNITAQKIVFGSVEYVNSLVISMEDDSYKVKRKACAEARDLIFANCLRDSQRIYLYEHIILHSPDPLVMFNCLNELRYYYIDLLLDGEYDFNDDDKQLLERMATDENNGVYRSSFAALGIYIHHAGHRYFKCRYSDVQKSIDEIKDKDESIRKFKDILQYEQMRRKYKDTQDFINTCLEYVRYHSYISLERLEYLPGYLKKEEDPEAKRNLLLLSNFLYDWYSVKDEDGDFSVPLHEEDFEED